MYIEHVHVYVYFKDKNSKKQYSKYVFFFRIRCQQIPVDCVCFKYWPYLRYLQNACKINIKLKELVYTRIEQFIRITQEKNSNYFNFTSLPF